MKIQRTVKTLGSLAIMFAALACCPRADAQQVIEQKRPGDLIRLAIRFEGRDATEIKSIALIFITQTKPATQTALRRQFRWDDIRSTERGTFAADVKIPEDIVSGSYTMMIEAQGEKEAKVYDSSEAAFPSWRIMNDAKLAWPQVKVKVVPERP